MDAVVEGVLQQAVVRALHDAQPQIGGVAEGVQPQPLLDPGLGEVEVVSRSFPAGQHRQVMDHVQRHDPCAPHRPGRIDQIGPVALRLADQLGDHVIVGDHVPLRPDEEAGAD